MRPDYPEFLRSIYEQWDCDRVVHIGDLVDWHSLNFHGRDPNLPAVKSEVRKARKQIGKLHDMFPFADWLIGNHDALPSRQATEAGLPDDMLLGDVEYWRLEGWKAHPRFTHLKIDGVLYSHGEAGGGGKYAAINQSRANFQSTVIGHFHALGGVWYTCNRGSRVFGMNVGTGMDWKRLQFSYGWKFASKPVLGCGVVIDGKTAYFEPMLAGSRR